jgi:hypothetical protein
MAKSSGSFGQGRHRQCAARSKRSHQRCRGVAVTGFNVCRMHGARSPGATRDEGHWNFQHGLSSKEAKEVRRLGRASLRRLKELGAIDGDGRFVPPNERPPLPAMSRAEIEALLKREAKNMRSAEQIRARMR